MVVVNIVGGPHPATWSPVVRGLYSMLLYMKKKIELIYF